MRKIGLVALIACLLNVSMWTGSSYAEERFTPQKRHDKCRYESWNGRRGFTTHEVRLLIDCATDHFPVSGGDSTAFYVAERESGYFCKADNPISSAGGIFQMLDSTWASWWGTHARYFSNHGWKLRNSRYLCRANVMIAMRSAHQWGWGPWGF